MQSTNRGTGVEDRCMDTKGEGRWDKMGNWDWHIYTTDNMFKVDN